MNGLCALLYLRTQDFLRLLLGCGVEASAITIPGSSGPGALASVNSFRALGHARGNVWQQLCFCNCKLILDSMRVILGSIFTHVVASFAVYAC